MGELLKSHRILSGNILHDLVEGNTSTAPMPLPPHKFIEVLRFAGYLSRASVNGRWLSYDRHQTGYRPY